MKKSLMIPGSQTGIILYDDVLKRDVPIFVEYKNIIGLGHSLFYSNFSKKYIVQTQSGVVGAWAFTPKIALEKAIERQRLR